MDLIIDLGLNDSVSVNWFADKRSIVRNGLQMLLNDFTNDFVKSSIVSFVSGFFSFNFSYGCVKKF